MPLAAFGMLFKEVEMKNQESEGAKVDIRLKGRN
jgi:hypothetical protein